ncbi:uncharacterized protein LOC111089773, partial [Limulus polyphemus]|uniref:Uncharacterized protein LOC111089773 n=1 Tax=Limulus polyphemus TaxID=6850 RepID=A0ABM1TRN0_LIMPO
KKDPRNAFTVQNVFCPINGKFRFTFHGNNGNYRCDEPYPELSNCPHGNTLEFRFHQCTFPDTSTRRISYGLGVEFLNPQRLNSNCFSLSAASCGKAVTLKVPSRSLPAPVLTTMCEFPSWFQGRWENLEVSGNKFVYEDHRKLQAITAWCVTMETNTPFELFHIYTVTQCGDEAYNCVWLQQRTENIVELQLGVSSSSEYIPSFCRNHRFEPHTWVTLGRIDVTESESCPISGTYIGAASGGERLCAKLATDCDSPDILFYSIRGCKDKPYSYGASSGSVNHQSQSFYGDLQEHEPIGKVKC